VQYLIDHRTEIAAIAIFAATYLVVAVGRLPGFRIDRTGAALLGGSLMVAAGVLSLEQAYRAIDFDTVALLLGMMIVVANLRLSGFFDYVTRRMMRRVRRPETLLLLTVGISGLFSAFLVNDTICLVLAPLVLDLVLSLRRDPVPYLLGIAMASNIGSTATITGNPQNIIIGSLSHIAYVDFLLTLAPIALAGLCVTVLLIRLSFPGEFRRAGRLEPAPEQPQHLHRGLALKSVAVTLAMVVGFFLVEPVAKSAIVAGAVLLLTRRVKPRRVYAEINWALLVLFAGLFVVVAGLERAVLADALAGAKAWPLDRVPVMTGVAAVLSNLVSNVPAVLMLRPFVEQAGDQRTAWLTLAMASTLAGNFTILGSVANLIVVQMAAQRGVTISFWSYFKLGAPLTAMTLGIGVFWLWH
jgi:Na+/H+ antiporter NhaD/arsenite permease-like protein